MVFADAFETYRDKKKRVDKWMKLFLGAVPEQKRGVLLDCGCGVGRFCIPLAPFFETVFGLDADENMLSIAKQKTNRVKWICADICNTPLDNDSVDVALASMLTEHLERPEPFFRELFRLIKPGGIVLIRTMLPKDISSTTWYQFSETAYKMELGRTRELNWMIKKMSEYGFSFSENDSVLNVHEMFDDSDIVNRLLSKSYEILHQLDKETFQRLIDNAKQWEKKNMRECLSSSLIVFIQERKCI